jgi:hypothetical protein
VSTVAIAPAIEPFLNAEQCAKALGGNLSAEWIEKKARAGLLPSHKLGHYRRYIASEVATALRSLST